MSKFKIGGIGKQRFISLLTAAALVISEAGGLMAAPLNALAAEEPEVIGDYAEAEQPGTDADLALSGQDEVPADKALADAEATYSDGAEDAGIVEDSETEDQAANPDADVVDADDNIFGDASEYKDKYYITFTVNNADNKEQPVFTVTKELGDKYERYLNEFDFYDELWAELDDYVNSTDPAVKIVGWSVYTDGFNTTGEESYKDWWSSYQYSPVYLNADGHTYDYGGTTKEFSIYNYRDYHYVAQVSKAAADNMYVTAIPSVYYDGRQHVSIGTKGNGKKQAADLRLRVYKGYESDVYSELTLGQDYTVSYKNNVNASMKLIRTEEDGNQGSYVKAYNNDSERPVAVITGKGTYKGFSASVYFDILPMNLGAFERSYEFLDAGNDDPYDSYYYNYPRTYMYSESVKITGFANSYGLTDSGPSKLPAQKITKSFGTSGYDDKGSFINKYVYATNTLVKDKDYRIELYKWDEDKEEWIDTGLNDPAKIDQKGDYLYLIRGIGNYCGAVYEENPGFSNYDDYGTSVNVFETGYHFPSEANPWRDITSAYQFRITDDLSRDLSLARVKIGRKSIPYDDEDHDARDFKIEVWNKDGKKLSRGVDYRVEFGGQYAHSDYDEDDYYFSPNICDANNYCISIGSMNGHDGYYGELFIPYEKGVKIQGLKLKASMFKLSAKKVPVGESATWSISEAGIKQKLTREDSSNVYYIGGYSRVIGSYYDRNSASKLEYRIGGGGYCGRAIDPTSTVSLTWGHSAMTLQQVIDAKLLTFEIPDSAEFNVKGAIPEKITAIGASTFTFGPDSGYGYIYPGCTINPRIKNIGYVGLTLTFKNNLKVGSRATVIAKVKYGAIKGSAVIGEYVVKTKNVEDLADGFESYGCVKAEVGSSLKSKGSLDKPMVTLYQSYRDTNGFHWAKIGESYYSSEKGNPVGNAGIAAEVIIKNGTAEGFDFGMGITTSVPFGLYDKAVNVKDITKIEINGTKYDVVNGTVNYNATFTGDCIWLYPSSITLKDGTELNWGDYTENSVWDGKTNIPVGTGNTSLTFKYNQDQDRYPYGGTVKLKFKIVDSNKINL